MSPGSVAKCLDISIYWDTNVSSSISAWEDARNLEAMIQRDKLIASGRQIL